MASRRSSAKSRPGSSRPSIEYYMRPESRMSEIPKPKHEEGKHFHLHFIQQNQKARFPPENKSDA